VYIIGGKNQHKKSVVTGQGPAIAWGDKKKRVGFKNHCKTIKTEKKKIWLGRKEKIRGSGRVAFHGMIRIHTEGLARENRKKRGNQGGWGGGGDAKYKELSRKRK